MIDKHSSYFQSSLDQALMLSISDAVYELSAKK